MRRLAKRQGIELRAEVADRDLAVVSDPFRLQLVLASVIEHLAQSLEAGGGIVLGAQGTPREVTMLLEVQGTKKAEWQGLADTLFPTLREVLETLRASLAISASPAPEGVIMTVSVTEPGSA
jgi:hypothetical protein